MDRQKKTPYTNKSIAKVLLPISSRIKAFFNIDGKNDMDNNNKQGGGSKFPQPKFSIYWIYAIVALAIIGLNFFYSGGSLMEAGFVVTASWPVNTEAEGSLHIRDKAACNSTVFLVCRLRLVQNDTDTVFWEDRSNQFSREAYSVIAMSPNV